MAEDALFNLRWDAQRSALLGSVAALYRDESFVDLTIVTNGQMFKAHKLLLSASSPYLKTILESVPSQHAVLFMPHITSTDLSNVLKFVYEGEIKISRRALKSFLETAKTLKIKGMDFDFDNELDDLEGTTTNMGSSTHSTNSHSTGNVPRASSPSRTTSTASTTSATTAALTNASGPGQGQGSTASTSSSSVPSATTHSDESEAPEKLKILSSLLLKQEPNHNHLSDISINKTSISTIVQHNHNHNQNQTQSQNSPNNNNIPSHKTEFRDIKHGNRNGNLNQGEDSPSGPGEIDESDEDMSHEMDMIVEDVSDADREHNHRHPHHHRIIRMDGSGGEIIDIDEEGLDDEGNYHEHEHDHDNDQDYSDDEDDIHSISILPEVSLQESDESYNLSNVHHLQQALKLSRAGGQGSHHHMYGTSQQQQAQLKALGMNKLRPLVPKGSSSTSSSGPPPFNEGILLRMMREPLLSSSKTTSPASSSAGSTAAGTGMSGGSYYDLGHGEGIGGLRKTKRYVQCGSCSKVLSSLSALKRHMEDVHCARIQGKCIICGRVYSSRNSLLTHVYSAHKKHHDYKAVARIIRESDFEKFATA